jgi:dTDP-4-dehydrorhamnose 3,5-epimerase
MALTFIDTPITDLYVIEPRVFADNRGFFMESYKECDFLAKGITAHFSQDNHSKSTKGIVRGLHYQLAPHAQGKLVRVVSGAVWDVAIDLRKDSATYGKWFGIELNEENKKMFWIPEGFAHGFVALSETVDFLYKATHEYHQASERAIAWNDPELAITWPVEHPILSEKDLKNPRLADILESDRLL